jgi:hypothetical protein
MPIKKSANKQFRRLPRWLIVVGMVGALAMIGAAAAILSRPSSPPVATVNGAPITQDALRERLAFEDFVQANQPVALPQDRTLLLRALLNHMIDEEVIRQKAREMDITAAQAEIEARLAAQFGQTGVQEIAARTADATGLPPNRARALWLAQAEYETLVEKITAALGGPPPLDVWRAEAEIIIDEAVLAQLLEE